MMRFIKGVGKGMHGFGLLISGIVNFVLLSIVYAIGVGVTALVAKIAGKRFIETEPHNKKTYWSTMSAKKRSFEEHYRQF